MGRVLDYIQLRVEMQVMVTYFGAIIMYIKTSMPLEHAHNDLAIGRSSQMNNLRIIGAMFLLKMI